MTTTCQAPGCHNLLMPTKRGRSRVWCSTRCRKTKYSVPCVDCGAPLNGSDGRGDDAPTRCVDCSAVRNGAMRKVWTREMVLLAIQDWAAEYGEPPAEADWNPYMAEHVFRDPARAIRFREAGGRWPWYNTPIREFGSWVAALEAAGFDARPAHGGGANVARRRNQRAKAAA